MIKKRLAAYEVSTEALSDIVTKASGLVDCISSIAVTAGCNGTATKKLSSLAVVVVLLLACPAPTAPKDAVIALANHGWQTFRSAN